jgi:tryptophan 2,3-dioxygenase
VYVDGMSHSSNKEEKVLSYSKYLELNKILNAQSPESVKHGIPAHDETLFIIVHQVYELWSKTHSNS